MSSRLSRYEDRLQTIEMLEKEIITLQHLLSNHSRRLGLKDVLNITNTYNGITLMISSVECWISTDRKANWISEEEAEELTELLSRVKCVLNMLM